MKRVRVEQDEEKLAELILYVSKQLLADPAGGATKLNKILFAAEFAYVRTHGRPITGVEYQKLPRGPAPRRLRPIRDRLVSGGSAELVDDRYMGYPLARIKPLREPDLTLFSPDELQQIDEAIADLRHFNGAQVSSLSHEEMGWKLVEEGETIPYEAAFLASSVEVTPAMRAKGQELANHFGL